MYKGQENCCSVSVMSPRPGESQLPRSLNHKMHAFTISVTNGDQRYICGMETYTTLVKMGGV